MDKLKENHSSCDLRPETLERKDDLDTQIKLGHQGRKNYSSNIREKTFARVLDVTCFEKNVYKGKKDYRVVVANAPRRAREKNPQRSEPSLRRCVCVRVCAQMKK
uniref:Uncharacterized protein n=1 Tax=Trichogramma kaykai TaxID=54128 RepID=A0ABD2XDK3_9HYME